MTLEEFPLFNLLEEFEKDWYKFLVWLLDFFSEAIWFYTVCSYLFLFFFFQILFHFWCIMLFLLDSVLVGCIFLETCPFLSSKYSLMVFCIFAVSVITSLSFLTLFGSSLLLGEPGQKFVNIVFTLSQNQLLVLLIFPYF